MLFSVLTSGMKLIFLSDCHYICLVAFTVMVTASFSFSYSVNGRSAVETEISFNFCLALKTASSTSVLSDDHVCLTHDIRTVSFNNLQ